MTPSATKRCTRSGASRFPAAFSRMRAPKRANLRFSLLGVRLEQVLSSDGGDFLLLYFGGDGVDNPHKTVGDLGKVGHGADKVSARISQVVGLARRLFVQYSDPVQIVQTHAKLVQLSGMMCVNKIWIHLNHIGLSF